VGRRVVSLLGCLLLCSCGAARRAEPEPGPTYPTSFQVADPEFDAETTAAGFEHAPNVDLVGISAHVGDRGLRATFRYAGDWDPASRARWGIRFEVIGSDRSRISGAWTHDRSRPSSEVRLAPRRVGCTARVHLAPSTRRLALQLSEGCLPGTDPAPSRRWVRFDTLESVTSWHAERQILYAWDQLYARLVAPEPKRLYLPH
jgi:hypothetical protein